MDSLHIPSLEEMLQAVAPWGWLLLLLGLTAMAIGHISHKDVIGRMTVSKGAFVVAGAAIAFVGLMALTV